MLFQKEKDRTCDQCHIRQDVVLIAIGNKVLRLCPTHMNLWQSCWYRMQYEGLDSIDTY